jgi:tetratricopeptide (TPR) repeat protein
MRRGQRLGSIQLASACLILLATLASRPARADDPYADKRSKLAAVIGISAYKNASALPNTLGDAGLVARKLAAAGFDITAITDAPLADFTALLQTFTEKTKGADIALVYYAGHAVQIDGENYMVPSDFDGAAADIFAGLVPVKALLESLNKNAQARVLLLDACRDNPFQEKLKSLLGARASGQGLAAIQMPVVDGRNLPQGTRGLVVGYATQPQNVAADGKRGQRGPYASALEAALTNPDDDFNSVLVRVTRTVLAATNGKQQPEHRMALTGPLYLVSRKEPYQCDVLAAEPDNDVSVAGVEFEEIDVAKALPACEADSAENPDSPRLMHNLGKTLERSGKLIEAVALYRKAAERGYDWAQVYLAVASMEGTGVAPDMEEGVSWLRKAFEQGNRQALITYTELDLSRAFDNKPWRVKLLQKALRDAGETGVPDTDVIDDPTSTSLGNFISSQGIEGKAITFQVLDRLGIVEAMFPKKEAAKQD